MKDGLTIGIIQARMASTRLPGKVLAPIAGRPLLQLLLQRLAPSEEVDRFIVATSTEAGDEPIVRLCDHLAVPCYRGSHLDVLDRFYGAARLYSGETIVRLTADNPLVDAEFVDLCVAEYRAHRVDYLDTMSSGTFPYGLSVEVFSYDALEWAWRNASAANQREHVTLAIREHSGRFSRFNLAQDQDESAVRATVDTEEDLTRIARLCDAWPEIPSAAQCGRRLLELAH